MATNAPQQAVAAPPVVPSHTTTDLPFPLHGSGSCNRSFYDPTEIASFDLERREGTHLIPTLSVGLSARSRRPGPVLAGPGLSKSGPGHGPRLTVADRRRRRRRRSLFGPPTRPGGASGEEEEEEELLVFIGYCSLRDPGT